MKQDEDRDYTDLLIKISSGDQKSFAQVYEIFYPPLLKHTTSKVGDLTVAEDILHNLFLSLWNNRERLVVISSLSAYLYTSCRYLTIQHIKKTIKDEQNIILFHESRQDNAQSIEDRLYFRYLLDIVNSEIESLPERCKQVFKLSREELKSNKEIAACLNLSESTVENQINKALKRIRNATVHLVLTYLISLTPAGSSDLPTAQIIHLMSNHDFTNKASSTRSH
jgi:RNA polymerase sigma-70 factor (ECF subfamily)